ncbi:MAG: phage gp6-like head-tail connector protein, partial [SAR324 cluster bacterium]|nr:phage gp6-like head-tail connector protein [SAR324 cluster bacterium]
MPAQDLTDLTTLKNHLKITGGDFDALLTGLVSQVSSAIESTTKRQIKERTSVTEYMDGPGKGTLSPRQSPINSIASIHVDSLRLWASTALVLTTDYAIDQSGVLIRGLGGKIFSKGVQNIKLVYDYGYATVPDDLPQVRRVLDATTARFLVIDPLNAHLAARIDSHKDAP